VISKDCFTYFCPSRRIIVGFFIELSDSVLKSTEQSLNKSKGAVNTHRNASSDVGGVGWRIPAPTTAKMVSYTTNTESFRTQSLFWRIVACSWIVLVVWSNRMQGFVGANRLQAVQIDGDFHGQKVFVSFLSWRESTSSITHLQCGSVVTQ
jgi:hypothetical protein